MSDGKNTGYSGESSTHSSLRAKRGNPGVHGLPRWPSLRGATRRGSRNDGKRYIGIVHLPNSLIVWIVLAIVALVRLLTLGLYPLNDTTEARYAEVARKMVELNDWITPWYDYGVPFWAKPPLSTWLTAISFKLFGINEFAARLPYLLLAVLIAWLVWDWVARSAGPPAKRQAMLTVALMSGSMLYLVASAAVMTDLALVLGTTLAMRGFWAAFKESESSWPKEVWLLFIGLGIGMLAKGPIALVLSGLPIGIWVLASGHHFSVWKRLPWLKGTLLTIAIALPWYWLAEMKLGRRRSSSG